MRRLSEAELRRLAAERQLSLEEDDIKRLRPMVESLLAVAEGLRSAAARWAGPAGLYPERKRAGRGP